MRYSLSSALWSVTAVRHSCCLLEKSYDRDALTSEIVRHGGMVVGSPLEVGGDMDGVFCVSDGPCRKRKFLLALAVGVPCVSFQFVLECVKQVRLSISATSACCHCERLLFRNVW